jgi:hypothetical protein
MKIGQIWPNVPYTSSEKIFSIMDILLKDWFRILVNDQEVFKFCFQLYWFDIKSTLKPCHIPPLPILRSLQHILGSLLPSPQWVRIPSETLNYFTSGPIGCSSEEPATFCDFGGFIEIPARVFIVQQTKMFANFRFIRQ